MEQYSVYSVVYIVYYSVECSIRVVHAPEDHC